MIEISIFLRTYGYCIIGPLLILINIFVFLLVIMRKTFRETYVVLAAVFFNSTFTGIAVLSLALKRLITPSINELINHHNCVLDVPILLMASYTLNGFGLLMNSIERLCVVAFPIYYYKNNMRINFTLITVQYLIVTIITATTVIASLFEPTRLISDLCILQTVYSPIFYQTILYISCITSSLSVVLMILVVIILKRKFNAQYFSKHSCNRDLTHFLNNQKRYTQTALISCFFTLLLAVVTTIAECVAYKRKSTHLSRNIILSCVYLRILNCFNMVLLFLYRQSDIRSAIVECFKQLFQNWKKRVRPINGFQGMNTLN